jgi:hypothetical protein
MHFYFFVSAEDRRKDTGTQKKENKKIKLQIFVEF